MSSPAERIIRRAGTLSVEEAADLYRAYAARLLIDGWVTERRALATARRIAQRRGLLEAYDDARRAAVTAWRRALPTEQGPWLLVGRAIANAAGAVALESALDHDTFQLLTGPWRQAIGFMTPVGPGLVGATEARGPSALTGPAKLTTR